jgi:hypothetical protein
MNLIRKNDSRIKLNLRLAPEELKAVDDLCRSRAGHCSRNTWIAEAVAEKLARENRGRSRGSNA